MKIRIFIFASLLLSPVLWGQLVITEIMSSSQHSDTTRNGDWWELTNIGATSINLQNYSWNDDPAAVGAVVFSAAVSIQPGESIIILDEADATNVGSFKGVWGLTDDNPVTSLPYQVLDRSNFTPNASWPGFSSTKADGVNLFNPFGTPIASAVYTSVSPAGISRAWFTDKTAVPGEFSVVGQLGAYLSTDVMPDTASPGSALAPPANTPPYFTGVSEAFALAGTNLAASTFRIEALDANLGQTVTYTLVSGPAWLSLAADGAQVRLVGTPPASATGLNPFTVRASDDSTPTPAATERVYTLTVIPATSPVIVNEYNAVDAGKFLNGGTLEFDSDFGAAADLLFGRVDENGGDWFELVVVGSGSPGTVDLRGWQIELSQTVADVTTTSATLVLSQAPYWATVPTGTLLTFIENNTAQAGLDTGIEIRNRRNTLGDSWTNIWIGDPVYLTYTDAATNGYTIAEGLVTGVAIDERDTRITLKNAAGEVVAGPFGEGVAVGINVSSTEVFALNADPSPTVSPLAGADNALAIPGYKDKSNRSSCGLPNDWSGVSQSFAAFVRPTTPYESWVAGFALADPSPAADPDGDGRSNWTEYAFGGHPGIADGPPTAPAADRVGTSFTWHYVRRGDDPSLAFSHQRSGDLIEWQALTPISVTTAPHPTLTGFVIATVTAPATSVGGREFFRAALP